MRIEKDNSLLPRARRLRREMTPHERKLWYLFLRHYPVKIYKQKIIQSYIVDFYCAPAKLVIKTTPLGSRGNCERTAPTVTEHGLFSKPRASIVSVLIWPLYAYSF